MVSTRVMIALGTFIILLGFGSGWIAFSSSPSGYTYFDIATGLGSSYGPCNCPPTSDTIQGEFLLLLLPIVASPGPLIASMIAYPAAFVLAAYSFFRWKVMWAAGALSVFSGALWFTGVYLDQASIVGGLESWSGSGGGAYSVYVQLGAYFALAGGAVLLLGYVLSKTDKLDWPID